LSNDSNRLLIVIAAAAMIVLAALLIFITWSADTDAINSLGDVVEFLDDHNDNAGKLIITLAALIVVVLSLLIVVVELAPEDEQKELRVKQEGATTIVPAAALRARIEEALVTLPEVSAARARVSTRDNGIATSLDLTLTPGANISEVTQESVRVVTDTVQSDLGLPLAGVPAVRVSFGGPKSALAASSTAQPPSSEPAPEAAAAIADDPPAAQVVSEPSPPAEISAAAAPEPPAWNQGEPPTPADADAPPDGDALPRDPWRQP